MQNSQSESIAWPYAGQIIITLVRTSGSAEYKAHARSRPPKRSGESRKHGEMTSYKSHMFYDRNVFCNWGHAQLNVAKAQASTFSNGSWGSAGSARSFQVLGLARINWDLDGWAFLKLHHYLARPTSPSLERKLLLHIELLIDLSSMSREIAISAVSVRLFDPFHGTAPSSATGDMHS